MEALKQVIDFLQEYDADAQLIVHTQAKNSQQAAQAMDIQVEQIVKSVVFVAEEDSTAGWVVLVQGHTHVDTNQLEKHIGRTVRMATPEEVQQQTPFRVGGVSPFAQPLPVIVDEAVLGIAEIQPAAGSTCVGALLTPAELVRLTRADVAQLS